MTTHAASVLIVRGASDAPEVLVIRRSRRARFMSDFHAFPGGHAEPGDGEPGTDAALRQTAVRETFEEVGVTLDPQTLVHAGFWNTPAYLVTPLCTTFYLAPLPEGETPQLPPTDAELWDMAFRRPGEVLEAWTRGQVLLAPPTRHLLRVLQTHGLSAPERFSEAPEARGIPPRFAPIRRHVDLFPVLTPTLPPATHTNVYVLGDRRLCVVDPASTDPGQQAELLAYLDARVRAGARVEAIVLTHAHHDHSAGAPAIAAHFGVPILAHPDALPGLPFAAAQGVLPALRDGELLAACDVPFEVMHTPGHAPGHCVFFCPEDRTVVAGDLVAGVGTILVDPDEGSMTQYLDSLARVRARAPSALLPAHGGVMGGASEKLTEYIDHRLWREGRVEAALAEGEADLSTLVRRVYDDVAPHVWPIAVLSLRAHLARLAELGRAYLADPDAGRWAAVRADRLSGADATR